MSFNKNKIMNVFEILMLNQVLLELIKTNLKHNLAFIRLAGRCFYFYSENIFQVNFVGT